MYSCPSMPPAPCPPDCPPSKPKHDSDSRYYREIGTALIGNQLIIRMERQKGKSKKAKDWDPPCDCDVVEIQRPTRKQGPKILKGSDNNRILFRVESTSDASNKSSDESQPRSISYEVGQCKEGPNTNNQCRTVTFYPDADGIGCQEVHTDRLTYGNENIFLLRVKKKPDSVDQPRRHVELEMRTPKPPPLPPPEQPEAKREESRKVVIAEKKEPVPEKKSKKEVAKKKSKKKF